MKNLVLEGFAFNLNYAKLLVGDVSQDQMCDQPGGLKNHPAWAIGHLTVSCDFTGSMLGLQPINPQEWGELLGMDSQPVADTSKYPDKQTLVDAFEKTHQAVAKAYEQAPDSLLAKPTPHEGFRKMFPTIGQALFFMMGSHESIHLGQLASWRQVKGLPRAFGG